MTQVHPAGWLTRSRRASNTWNFCRDCLTANPCRWSTLSRSISRALADELEWRHSPRLPAALHDSGLRERPEMAARQALECPSGGDQRLTDRVLRQMARGGNRAGGGQFTDAVALLNCAIVAVSPWTEAIFSADSPNSRSFFAKDAVDGCG